MGDSRVPNVDTNNSTSTTPNVGPIYPLYDEQQARLNDFSANLNHYRSVIPDSVAAYYLNRAGFEACDQRIIRLTAIAAQKFISDILHDSLQHCKMRQASQSSKRQQSKESASSKNNLTLTSEDLSLALAEHGIALKNPPYFG